MREEYTVIELCQALGLSSSGYYRWRTGRIGLRNLHNQQLIAEIKEIHADRHARCYGSPRMAVELNERGFCCSVNRVARLMNQNGLRARQRHSYRPKTTQQDPQSMPAPNRLAEAPDPTGPGQLLVSDITYIATRQYTSHQLRNELTKRGWTQSMSALGYCYDNAICESFFASLKKECFPENGVFNTKQEARLAIFDYLEIFYNKRRRHSSLGYLSPEAFLQKHFQNHNHNLN